MLITVQGMLLTSVLQSSLHLLRHTGTLYHRYKATKLWIRYLQGFEENETERVCLIFPWIVCCGLFVGESQGSVFQSDPF